MRNNNLDFVSSFVKDDHKNLELLNSPNEEENETPLFYALKFLKSNFDRKKMVETLLELGADPRHKNHKGMY